MAIPKYTDPAVQNRTQDATTDHLDDLKQKNDTQPGVKNKNSASDKKRRAYKEGIKDDSNTEGATMNKHASYGKRL